MVALATPRTVGALTVALVALYGSYWHIADRALASGQRTDIAYLVPFAIDGVMLVAGSYAMARNVTASTRMVALVGFGAAWSFSAYANVASAPLHASLLDQIIAGAPAWALLITAVMLHQGNHKPRPKRRPQTAGAASGQRTVSAPAQTTPGRAVVPSYGVNGYHPAYAVEVGR
jgi:peptidoglycan/LPS O-acetylase OafA/YrhL